MKQLLKVNTQKLSLQAAETPSICFTPRAPAPDTKVFNRKALLLLLLHPAVGLKYRVELGNHVNKEGEMISEGNNYKFPLRL